jgi:cell division protein FtsL
MMRRLPPQYRNAAGVRRERDGAALRRQVVMLVCGLLMAGGFVLAVGQRFQAVRYGYEGERLREERARLVAERERLLLELNAAASPVSLEQAARGLGMQPARASQIGAADSDARPRRPAEESLAGARLRAVKSRR